MKAFEDLDINDFVRKYTNKSVEIKEPAEHEMQEIFASMNKTDAASQKMNCESCGYSSCRNMARAIYNGVNVKENCVHYVKSVAENEKESAKNTANSFSSIQENTLSIQSGIQNLTVSTSELKDANQVISDSVQTLSAISEELTAHAHETLEAENKNTDILDTIASKMQELVIFTQNQF